jgi:hypothetical protein
VKSDSIGVHVPLRPVPDVTADIADAAMLTVSVIYLSPPQSLIREFNASSRARGEWTKPLGNELKQTPSYIAKASEMNDVA